MGQLLRRFRPDHGKQRDGETQLRRLRGKDKQFGFSNSSSRRSSEYVTPPNQLLELEDIFSSETSAELNEELRDAKRRLAEYEVDGEHAQHKRDELVNLLTRMVLKYTKASGWNVHMFAEQRMNDENASSAILFVQVAANLHERENSDSAATGVQCCCGLLQTLAETGGARSMIRDRVIPIIDSLKTRIGRLDNVEHKLRIRCEATCMSSVALLHLQLEEYEQATESARRGVQHFESNLPLSTCQQFEAYGFLLVTLAAAHHAREHFPLAIETFERAAASLTLAVDFPSESDKRRAIDKTEKSLQEVINHHQ